MPLSANEQQFVEGVAKGTGIDPRVLVAWIQEEGHPGDQYNNYMNITAATASYNRQKYGAPAPSGSTIPTDNPTAEFGNVQQGVQATVAEINSLGIKFGGLTPRQEIANIAASGWAQSEYGGPGGPNLVQVFEGDYPGGQIDSKYQGSGQNVTIDPTHNPNSIGGPAGSVVHAGENVVGGITSGVKFFTSWRFAEIVGGFILLLVGLLLLGRQFGIRPPIPTPPGIR